MVELRKGMPCTIWREKIHKDSFLGQEFIVLRPERTQVECFLLLRWGNQFVCKSVEFLIFVLSSHAQKQFHSSKHVTEKHLHCLYHQLTMDNETLTDICAELKSFLAPLITIFGFLSITVNATIEIWAEQQKCQCSSFSLSVQWYPSSTDQQPHLQASVTWYKRQA